MTENRCLTRHGQVIQDLAQEFIKAIKESKAGSKDADDLFDFYVNLERTHAKNDAVDNAIHRCGPGKLDVYTFPLFTHLKPRVSEYLLAWVCPQSNGIPTFVETWVGLYGTAFWETHKRSEEMTLEWMGEMGAKGKILQTQTIFPWYMASQNTQRQSVFNTIPLEQFYLGGMN
jgi:hypothetical protein